MSEEPSRAYRWVLPLVATFLCGGLGGAVFTWYINRPKPTIVTYRIATTTLTAPEASGLIPDLKVLVRGTPIQGLYAQNIELLPRQGPFVSSATVAFSFYSPVRIYGIQLESPSDLHRLECAGVDAKSKNAVNLPDLATEVSSVQCNLRPVLPQGKETQPFRVAIATNTSEVPHVVVAAHNLELVPADQFSPKEEKSSTWLLLTSEFIAILAWVVTALFLFYGRRAAELRSDRLELMQEIELERLKRESEMMKGLRSG